MMHREPHANGHVRRNGQAVSPMPASVHKKSKELNGISSPIPAQKNTSRHMPTNESDESIDSASNDVHAGHSPVTAFSRSLSTGPNNVANPLNVYSMSPRSTQVMYQYYSNPKGFYQNQAPLVHASRSVSGRYSTDEHASAKLRYKNNGRVRTTSDCCGSPPKASFMLSGIPHTLQNDVMEDPRRRAWSESDSHKKGSMNMSRMSALKKLRKKLGRSGSLKKKKDDINHNESLNHSVASINSLEKVEEGRQLDCSKTTSPCSSKRNTVFDEYPDLHKLSIHREDETVKSPSSLSPDSAAVDERTRSPSNDSLLDHDGDLIYQRFLEEHTCYDIMPTSCKLVVFDTRLQARKAFHALVENSVRSAPLWDSNVCCYVGMLTVTDFIKVILITHRSKNSRVKAVEEQTIESWRTLLGQQSSFGNVHPGDTLLHSLKTLMSEHFNGVPILDEETGDIFHVINHKRILRFLHLFMNELPKPSFMNKALGEVKIGTYKDLATVTKHHTILDVLQLLVNKGISAIPIVDEDGEVIDVFCKLDMISLAAQGLYHNMSMTMEIALAYRFTPLFEDEECPADTFSRFASPRPQRRGISAKTNSTSGGNDASAPMTNDYKSKDETSFRSGHSAVRGHTVVREKEQKSHALKRSDVKETQQAPPTPQSSHQPLADSSTPECTGHHRLRHKSLSNPLVKCQLSDKFQHVIDLMVTTDANLLVVIGQTSNHVVGVITVSDVLSFIVDPSGHCLPKKSPAHIHKKMGKRLYSCGTEFASSDQVAPETTQATDGSEDPFVSDTFAATRDGHSPPKLSSSSDVSGRSDSGYTSTSTLPKDSNLDPVSNATEVPHNRAHSNTSNRENVNARFLRRGVEMERS